MSLLLRALAVAGSFLMLGIPAAEARSWDVSDGKVAFSFPPGRLAALGLEVVGASGTVEPDAGPITGLEPPVFAFEIERADAAFRTADGRFVGFGTDEPAVLSARGGLSLRARDPATGRAVTPALLYDFRVEVNAESEPSVRILTAARDASPLVVRSARIGLDHRRNAFVIATGDVAVSPEWAAAMGRPELGGQIIGMLDLRLATAERLEAPDPAPASARGAGLDVELLEIYGLMSWGREGSYPAGTVGLSCATTACNPGNVAVPWQLAVGDSLIETHPFIGQALFREDSTGVLEMIGSAWVKHGFFAVDGSDCIFAPEDTCFAGGGVTLGIGCADTYGTGNNASRLFLGPREEVDPYAGSWTAWGSFFDDTPVDGFRDYFGSEISETAHRLEVRDEDLISPGARFFFEGAYYVAGDVDPSNNVGWEECTITWTGTAYSFSDFSPAQADNDGPIIATWGDEQVAQSVAADDGTAWIATKVTPLGGGQWHYEYAVYNYTSARGVRSFAVPTGFANISNVGFHDVDKDSLNDWTAVVVPGLVTWSTDDWATDPNAPALTYQTMFNFRFDADVPPVASEVLCGIFRPGVGTNFRVAVQAPSFGTTSAFPEASGPARFALHTVEPNPFRSGARVAFSLDRERHVRVLVADVTGRTVRTLLEGTAPAGRSSATWDGRDENGRRAAAGVYFFRLQAGEDARTIKGVLLR